MKRFAAILMPLMLSLALQGRETIIFSSTVHDFGQVLLSDGPVSCTFVGKNTSSVPVTLQSVSTSCGCTDVRWDHGTIAPGAQTKIAVTYTNDEGPYPFDKVITVKVAGEPKPLLLHIRGISVKAVLPDSQVFTDVFGSCIGMQASSLKTGNLEQGGCKGDQVTIANLSGKSVRVGFVGISDGLGLNVVPNPVPAGGHAVLHYTVSAREGKWGYNDYSATMTTDGISTGKSISVRAFTAENFSSLTKEERMAGSRPIFPQSTFSFGHKKQGSVVKAVFSCQNKGGKTLTVHKVDVDKEGASFGAFPKIAAGKSADFQITMDTKNLPKGEALVIVTLTTNSPVRPVVNLFLAGWID